MADPTPFVGLPNYEWIEIKNRSAIPVNIQGYQIGDLTGKSGPLPSFLLKPDSFLIVCSNSALSSLSTFGNTMAVSGFPSLDNNSDRVTLNNAGGVTIHAVQYALSWYSNTLKQDGGWTLEMIDTDFPCSSANNWKASLHPLGGTPGKVNSVNSPNPDTKPPELIQAFAIDSMTILLEFDESLDSIIAGNANHFLIDGTIQIQSAEVIAPLFSQVRLGIASALQEGRTYVVTSTGLRDCAQNLMAGNNTASTGLPALPGQMDVVVNEILFNPRSGGHDYVEFYNRSSKIVDASRLFVTNRNSSGTLNPPKPVSASMKYIFPGDYFVITPEPEQLGMHYLVKEVKQVLPMASMPSLPDDEGNISLLNMQGEIIDEVIYSDDWHFDLIQNPEGVSLERIDAESPSQDPMNWHSAASTSGYGTPGYRNSQYKNTNAPTGAFDVHPKIISPGNDGLDDYAILTFRMQSPGFLATVTIYDIAGRPVRHLVNNQLVGMEGSWTWDGLGDLAKKLPANIYVVHASFFDLNGKKLAFKKTIVVGR